MSDATRADTKEAFDIPAMLLAANEGGHVMELHAFLTRLPKDQVPVWLVPDTPQCRSLLAGEVVYWGKTAPSRDVMSAVENAALMGTILRRHRLSLAVSTGSSMAVSSLPMAAARGVHSVYIESAARVYSPSLSGRILARTPGVRTLTQYREWTTRRWVFAGSVFDCFEPVDQPPKGVGSMVVSLGTSKKYGFRRLVQRLVEVIPPGIDVLWQVGDTDVSGLPIRVERHLPHSALVRAMRTADVVVSHAGVGSALMALEQGLVPVLVPRRRRYGEHVDDHQEQIAHVLEARQLAVVRQADALEWSDFEVAVGRRAVHSRQVANLPI